MDFVIASRPFVSYGQFRRCRNEMKIGTAWSAASQMGDHAVATAEIIGMKLICVGKLRAEVFTCKTCKLREPGSACMWLPGAKAKNAELTIGGGIWPLTSFLHMGWGRRYRSAQLASRHIRLHGQAAAHSAA